MRGRRRTRTRKYPRIGENPNQVGTNNFTDNLLERRVVSAPAHDHGVVWLAAAAAQPLRCDGRAHLRDRHESVHADQLQRVRSGRERAVRGELNRGIDIGAYPLARTITTGSASTTEELHMKTIRSLARALPFARGRGRCARRVVTTGSSRRIPPTSCRRSTSTETPTTRSPR